MLADWPVTGRARDIMSPFSGCRRRFARRLGLLIEVSSRYGAVGGYRYRQRDTPCTAVGEEAVAMAEPFSEQICVCHSTPTYSMSFTGEPRRKRVCGMVNMQADAAFLLEVVGKSV